jgi:hypothetical protein
MSMSTPVSPARPRHLPLSNAHADLRWLTGCIESALSGAGFRRVEVVHNPAAGGPPRPAPPPPNPNRGRDWAPGTLVVARGQDAGPHTIRVVVGQRGSGRYLTALVNPPPWLPKQGTMEVEAEGRLERLPDDINVRSECTQCPIRHGCERAGPSCHEPLPDDCFLAECLRPRRSQA